MTNKTAAKLSNLGENSDSNAKASKPHNALAVDFNNALIMS